MALPEAPPSAATDQWRRPLKSLRISVIDRCDLRCAYCMPEEDYVWLPNQDILTFEEINRLVDVFVAAGVTKVRLTGGEPLLRGSLVDLVGSLAQKEGLEDLALTTNGTQLQKWAGPLAEAGLKRVTVSLDSLNPARLETLTRRAVLDRVVGGIREAGRVGFSELKLNTVVMRHFNDDEIIDFIEFGKEVGAEVRFIEYMDVGGATLWSMERVFSKAEILACIEDHYGPAEPQSQRGAAPAERYRLADGTGFGIIASTTEPFCRTCDRSRVTADGMWYLCLYGAAGINLRDQVRDGHTDADLVAMIRRIWGDRDDRGAEKRHADPARGVLYQADQLREDPHKEMHTRGG
jgi:cyclic pyranopterin phosphate synthase